MFITRTEKSPGIVELEIHTNLNDEAVAEFKSALYAELDRPVTEVRLNLDRVFSINSAALGALILFQKKAREQGKRVLIAECSDELRKILIAIRLDRIIDMKGAAPASVER